MDKSKLSNEGEINQNFKKEEHKSSSLRIMKVQNEISNKRIFDFEKMNKSKVEDQHEILNNDLEVNNLFKLQKHPKTKISKVEENKDDSKLDKNKMTAVENIILRKKKDLNEKELECSSFSIVNKIEISSSELKKIYPKLANEASEKINNLDKYLNKNISKKNNNNIKDSITRDNNQRHDLVMQSPNFKRNTQENEENKFQFEHINEVNIDCSNNLFTENNNVIKQIDKNISLEISDTEGNVVNILESRKNKNKIDILNDKFEEDAIVNRESNNLISFNNMKTKIKNNKEKEKKLSKENSIVNANLTKKESFSPTRKDQEKKLIFVKSNESIKLNKLNELSFANECNNFLFSNKNTNKEHNSISSNKSTKNNENKSNNVNRKSLESIKNVNWNDDDSSFNKGLENDFDDESNVFRMLNQKNNNLCNSQMKNNFKTGDESDYKIELETSKIFDELKINNYDFDSYQDPELTKTEEEHKFPFNKNKNKFFQEEKFDKNFQNEDIEIEKESYTNKENIYSPNNKNLNNNLKKSANNTDNNFSKFNNMNNFSTQNHNVTSSKNNLNNKADQPNSIFINMNYQTSNNFYSHNQNKQSQNENRPPSYKVEEISNIMKRVLEKNKKEAAAKSREFLNNYPQNYFNIGKTQTLFFMGPSQNSKSERPSTDHSKTRPHFDTINFLEINLYDQAAWRKHEEVWEIFKNKEDNRNENKDAAEIKNKKNVLINLSVNQNNLNKNPLIDKEKFLFPPNDEEVLISAYYNAYNISGKIIIDDNIQTPKEEINKWKNAYKKTVMRWHPDKLIPFIESLEIKDEDTIIKKAGVIIYHMNKNLKNIVETLKNVNVKKERMNPTNN